jgi:L-carnitine CoA-transferase
MWPANPDLPQFGCMAGLKVVHTASSVGGPFALQLLAENGADVVWVENALAPDVLRRAHIYHVDAERRNQRNLALNITAPEGRQIFCRLIEDADVFLESSKGGQYDKWGLSDAELWKLNPKLVICHVSGFGQSGIAEYVNRPCYDMIAQAFSGTTHYNRNPSSDPYPVGPYAGDYMSGLFATIGILMAVRNVERTGIGESVDVAQFECLLKTSIHVPDWFTDDAPVAFAGYPQPQAGLGCYECSDGQFVQLAIGGAGILRRAIEFLGLEYGSELFPRGTALLIRGTPAGQELDRAIDDYVSRHTADQVHTELQAAGITAQKVNTPDDLKTDPHIAARDTVEAGPTAKGTEVRYVAPVPRFANNPGRTWRHSPWFGMDNETILGQLGYNSEAITALYRDEVIASDPELKLCYPYSVPAAAGR